MKSLVILLVVVLLHGKVHLSIIVHPLDYSAPYIQVALEAEALGMTITHSPWHQVQNFTFMNQNVPFFCGNGDICCIDIYKGFLILSI